VPFSSQGTFIITHEVFKGLSPEVLWTWACGLGNVTPLLSSISLFIAMKGITMAPLHRVLVGIK
jgi:hypothetical protein